MVYVNINGEVLQILRKGPKLPITDFLPDAGGYLCWIMTFQQFLTVETKTKAKGWIYTDVGGPCYKNIHKNSIGRQKNCILEVWI